MSSENLTLFHALNKNSVSDLRDMVNKFSSEERINPNSGKQNLIEGLIDVIPEDEQEKIIDETFNTPKTRYTAHLGVFNASVLGEESLDNNIDNFNTNNDYDPTFKDYQTNKKARIELVLYSEEELNFYYTQSIKRPEFDSDSMESRPLITSRRIRVTIKPQEQNVSVFTGDRDLFNEVLTALTIVFGSPIIPLDSNKTGISNAVVGSFSFETVKTLDFIYHGLSQIGTIGIMTQIDLETSAKSKKPQRVMVKGEDLLDDKSICEYLFLHARDLVGVKIDLKFQIDDNEHKVSIEIGIRNNRIKIGVKKDNYSIEQVKDFFEILERNTQTHLSNIGLIDEEKTIKILDQIRSRALQQG